MSLQDLVIGGTIGAFLGAIFGAVGMYFVQIKGMKAEKKLDLSMKHTQTLKQLVFHKWQNKIEEYRNIIVKPLHLDQNIIKKHDNNDFAFKQYENYWSCIKEIHYPDLVERWESLRKEMDAHANNSCEFFKSLQRQVNEKAGISVGNYNSGLFATYTLVDDLYNELLNRQGISTSSKIKRLDINELDKGEKEAFNLNLSKPYYKLNFSSTIYAVAQEDIIKPLYKKDIPKILENQKNNQKVTELINEGNRLKSELVKFHKKLQEIRDTVNIIPGKCKACKL